jgi:nucleotide-binding universal stress UspA family protein
MYDRILVAYNASTNSTIALREAVSIARVNNAELTVLAIVPNAGSFTTVELTGPMDVQGAVQNRVQQAVEAVSKELLEDGINVKTNIRQGDPADEIIATAYRMKADLVVVGHSTKGMLARWLQGSIGAKLLTDLPCSLLIAAVP